ncbi:hypothetical protein [Streptomyces sp. SID13031]|nr:hypothetical protein [Streptomyces sp. SID13031]NEA31173.1 hypothetical protein [Streptomyces sp. SID13031]
MIKSLLHKNRLAAALALGALAVGGFAVSLVHSPDGQSMAVCSRACP